MNNKFLYSAYVLTQESVQKLKRALSDLDVEMYENLFLHHCTINYGHDTLPDALMGEIHTLKIDKLVVDNFAMAFAIDNAFLSDRAIPHITICTKKAYTAAYSNILLSNADNFSLHSDTLTHHIDIEVETIIQKFYSK